MNHRLALATIACLVLGVSCSQAQEPETAQDSAFGSSQKTAGSMLGIFYDLKQNPKRQPLPNPQPADSYKALGEFLDSGWDESVLSRFFRATKPLYATEVLIPGMDAGGAPKAFDLTGIVKPAHWVVIYKAQVSPPEDGTYRFVGAADDLLAVGVNGKTVLVQDFYDGHFSSWKDPSPKEKIPCWIRSGLKRGDWFTCKKDQIIDLDIMIGEIPGNLFGAYLLIEKQGASYPRNAGLPLLPVFQVRAKPIKAVGGENYVPFSVSPRPWICHP